MKQIPMLVVLVLFLFSCNKRNSPEQIGSLACYTYVKEGSEVSLRITTEDGNVTGTLVYAFKEKDKNTGSLRGKMHGDTLIARYTYTSEGIEGNRDVIFMRSGSSFIEGRGAIDPETGEPDFSDKANITFSKGLLLSKTGCID